MRASRFHQRTCKCKEIIGQRARSQYDYVRNALEWTIAEPSASYCSRSRADSAGGDSRCRRRGDTCESATQFKSSQTGNRREHFLSSAVCGPVRAQSHTQSLTTRSIRVHHRKESVLSAGSNSHRRRVSTSTTQQNHSSAIDFF